jgi:antagonist of KipI
MSLKVLRAGILSTLQDRGRYGYQRYGMPVGGVMDEHSHRLANLLVGNAEDEATLEFTLAGPRLEFTQTALIAICGGDFAATIGGREVPAARPVLARAGSVLDLAVCRLGCRAYLALAGGFDVPVVMGSKSTYLPASLGGFHGRALRRGDELTVQPAPAHLYPALHRALQTAEDFVCPKWSVHANAALLAHDHHRIRFMQGRHFALFSEASRTQFISAEFRIAANSDRMGYRLEGPTLSLTEPGEVLPEAVTFGSIQVPPDGKPIVLMANRQTTGGYPLIGEVASVDLPLLAQLPPGDTLRFEPITLEQSEQLYLQRERELALMREGLRERAKQ